MGSTTSLYERCQDLEGDRGEFVDRVAADRSLGETALQESREFACGVAERFDRTSDPQMVRVRQHAEGCGITIPT